MTNNKTVERNQQVACVWFFNGGREGMTKHQQVEYLIQECGFIEDIAYAAIGINKKNSYTVVIESEDGVERDLITFDTHKEAKEFCEMYDWLWADENNFHWEMCIRNNRI